MHCAFFVSVSILSKKCIKDTLLCVVLLRLNFGSIPSEFIPDDDSTFLPGSNAQLHIRTEGSRIEYRKIEHIMPKVHG
jgi:hypothetical protein